MAVDYKIIGARIREERLKHGMSQDALSDKMDISIAFLSRIERGISKINLERLDQISEILDIPKGYLLNGSSDSSETYLDKEFSNLLKSVSPEKQKLIYNVAKTIAETDITTKDD